MPGPILSPLSSPDPSPPTSAELLAAIVESSDDAIYSETLDGIITSWNAAAERIFGYAPEEVIGSPVSLLYPPDRPDELPANLGRLRRGERIEAYRTERMSRDGRRLQIGLSVSPIRSRAGGIIGASAIARDMTERAALEAGLRKGEEQARFLAEATALLASSLDYDTTLARVAELAVPQHADWASVDILEEDGSIRQVALAHSDPAKITWARELAKRFPPDPDAPSGSAKVIRTGEPEFYPEIPKALLDAAATDDDLREIIEQLHLTSSVVVPLRARERVLGAMTLVQAESERHYTEADLRLARELADRAAVAVDNARLYRDARAALHTRDEFLASVSHDLRSPLTTIRGLTQLAQRQAGRLAGDEGARLTESLEGVNRASRSMSRMIDELLDLSRIETGRPLSLNRQRMDLLLLVRQLAGEQARSAPRHRIAVEGLEDSLVGYWDALRIERVLANLLSNAVKYSPEGGPIGASARLVPGDGNGTDWAEVSLRDEGIGIPPAELPHIFERYHRAQNVPGSIPGLGIGLAGAKQIVEQHGGSLTVESEEGKGSVFTLRLPANGDKERG